MRFALETRTADTAVAHPRSPIVNLQSSITMRSTIVWLSKLAIHHE